MKKEDYIKKECYVDPNKQRSHGFSSVTFFQRKRIQELLEKGKTTREICLDVKISRSTLYYERMRMGSLDIPYDAEKAELDKKNKLCVKNRNKDTIPYSHHKDQVKIYKLLKVILENKINSDVKKNIQECLYILEKLGVNEEKIKKRLTLDEVDKIISLYQEGQTYATIAKKLNRSHSSIENCIQKYRNKILESTEEILYENIKSKWITGNE